MELASALNDAGKALTSVHGIFERHVVGLGTNETWS